MNPHICIARKMILNSFLTSMNVNPKHLTSSIKYYSPNRLGIGWKITILLRDAEGPVIPLGELPKRCPWRLAAAALAIPVNTIHRWQFGGTYLYPSFSPLGRNPSLFADMEIPTGWPGFSCVLLLLGKSFVITRDFKLWSWYMETELEPLEKEIHWFHANLWCTAHSSLQVKWGWVEHVVRNIPGNII